MTAKKLPGDNMPHLEWTLDARETRFVFDAAQRRAAELIKETRQELLELEHFHPLAKTYSAEFDRYSQYDGQSKEDLIAEKKRWLEYYERIYLFAMKAEDIVSIIQIKRDVQQMKDSGFFDDLFGHRRKGK